MIRHEPAARQPCLRRVLAFFKPYSLQFAVVPAVMVFAAIVGVVSPFIIRRIVDEALPKGDFRLLLGLFALLVAVAAATAIASTLQTFVSTRIGQAIMHDLRVRVYGHLQNLSLSFFTDTRSGEIQARIASDIGGLQALVTHTAVEAARNATVVVMTAIAMLLLDWRLALLSFAIIPGLAWLQYRIGLMREAIVHEQQERIADLSSTIGESLSIGGILLARTTGGLRHLLGRFTRTSGDVARLEVRSHSAGQWEWSFVHFALSVLPAVTLLAGATFMDFGVPMTIGTLVAMIALQEQLFWPLEEILAAGIELRTARALLARIFEYLDKPVGVTERPHPATLARTSMRGGVRLEHVTFHYEGSDVPAICDVSIDIPAGSHLAIVGATGSCKTTLAYLLARLYDVQSGSITYDGIDVRDLSFASLTDMLGVLTQQPFLFNASIADNLRFAMPDASDDELIAAARVAQVHELIAALPDGYSTRAGEGGYRFSGGEKQRLALARIVLRNPPVLLLDEATSALDTRTERLLSEALATLASSRTTITIAHRLSTVRDADQIIVLDKGRVVECGDHDSLVARSGIYAELVGSMN